MSHVSEEDLILYFYGETARAAAITIHLGSCAACEAAYRHLTRVLAAVAIPDAPARDDRYGLEVWQRMRHQLPEQRDWWRGWRKLAPAAVAIALTAAAFVAGRYTAPTGGGATPVGTRLGAGSSGTASSDAAVRERARLSAVMDHLDESERLLLDVANDDGGGEVVAAGARERAETLVAANRLYRDAAAQAGDRSTEAVLDDLERTLLDIVHAPSPLSAAALADVRARLDAAALVFKVRVLSRDLRDRESETPPVTSRKTT
jgi:hypothetical protein